MNVTRWLRQIWLNTTAASSTDYWDRRYAGGMNSGAGSYGKLAEFKARVLNDFVAENNVKSVLELGCGDGHQLSLAKYPRYLGLDVSAHAIDRCAQQFEGDETKSFLWYDPARTINLAGTVRADLTLSLDVIYHLFEDDIYERYLADLFSTAERFVIIYSSNREAPRSARHVRHRKFAEDVEQRFPQFAMTNMLENPHEESFADFYFYARH